MVHLGSISGGKYIGVRAKVFCGIFHVVHAPGMEEAFIHCRNHSGVESTIHQFSDNPKLGVKRGRLLIKKHALAEPIESSSVVSSFQVSTTVVLIAKERSLLLSAQTETESLYFIFYIRSVT